MTSEKDEPRDLDESLLEACEEGDQWRVQYLVAKGAGLDVVTEEGLGPLHLAAWSGALGLVQYLVEEQGVELEDRAENDSGKTM